MDSRRERKVLLGRGHLLLFGQRTGEHVGRSDACAAEQSKGSYLTRSTRIRYVAREILQVKSVTTLIKPIPRKPKAVRELFQKRILLSINQDDLMFDELRFLNCNGSERLMLFTSLYQLSFFLPSLS